MRAHGFVVRAFEPDFPVVLAAEAMQLPVGIFRREESREAHGQSLVSLDGGLAHPFESGRLWRKQVSMAVRENGSEPHQLKIEAGNPERAGIQRLLYIGRISLHVHLFPGPLQPQLVHVWPVYSRTTVRIFDADQRGVRVCLSERARHADTGLRICPAVKSAYINSHKFLLGL